MGDTISPSSSVLVSITRRGLGAIAAEKWFGFLAARWTIKEAEYNAVFPLYKPTWEDLTVSKAPAGGGKPSLMFEKSTKVELYVSVSHDGGYTLANALAEG
jgi:phosphopantetheinyl transferase (holo-ACP synthase)